MKHVDSGNDLTLLLALLAVFIFHSPFTRWWTSLGLPWYSMFVFWFVLLVLLAIKQWHTGRSDS